MSTATRRTPRLDRRLTTAWRALLAEHEPDDRHLITDNAPAASGTTRHTS